MYFTIFSLILLYVKKYLHSHNFKAIFILKVDSAEQVTTIGMSSSEIILFFPIN